jgi:DNA polymerase-3 subunit alpha
VTDGIVRVGDAIKRAAKDQMPALALTDLGNVFGLVKFYTGARGKGVKPVLGADLWIANEAEPDRPFRLLLLCRDRAGYLALCDLLTRAYLAPRNRGRAELTAAIFAATAQQCGSLAGLIALSGAHLGDVGEALLAGNDAVAKQRVEHWQALFGAENFYLEVQRYGQPQQDILVSATADLAAGLDVPLVATHPVQFLDRDDFRAHEARVGIAEGYTLSDTRRPHIYTEEQYFKSQDEMAALFADLPEALANSVEIAKRCNLLITLGKNYLPDFPTPDGMTIADFLTAEAQRGLEIRLQLLFPDEAVRASRREEYQSRLDLECKTIIGMGFRATS